MEGFGILGSNAGGPEKVVPCTEKGFVARMYTGDYIGPTCGELAIGERGVFLPGCE